MQTRIAFAMFLLYVWCMNISCIQVLAMQNYSEMQKTQNHVVQDEQHVKEAKETDFELYTVEPASITPYGLESKAIWQPKPIEEKEADIVQEPEQVYLFNLTDEEVAWLECLVAAEDGNEEENCQVAVAASILNRLESTNHDFKNLTTIADVIFQKNQYSTVRNGKFYHNSTEITPEMVSAETKSAVQRALYGEDPTEQLLREEAERLGLDVEKYVGNGATFFYSPRWCSEEALAARNGINVKIQYGEHIFYAYWD